MKNGYNIERLINLLSCSHCGTGFDESCIGLLEVSYDTVMVRIVCKECGKKYVLAFMDLNFSFFEATFGAPLEPDAFKEDIKKEQNENNILEDNFELKVDGCFEFIGQEPSTKICQDLNILDSEGYIVVNQNYQTKYPNVYAGGDCIKKDLYQIITACADGARIAEQILKK